MIDLEKTEMHRVYRTEILGDTMVVTLQGDAAGFAIGSVHNEMATLIGIARSPAIRHLVIDMSGSNYYGSLILGEIVSLGQVFREKGGRTALAGISPDMKEILRMMRLDGMWERYPTRAMALRALADIPWQQRVKPYVKPVSIAAGVLLLLALYLIVPRPDYTAQQYETMTGIWNEAQDKKSAGVSDTEWLVFSERWKEKLADLVRQLEKTADSSKPAAQTLLYAARDYAPKAIDLRLKPEAEETRFVNWYLAVAKAHLEKTTPPPPPIELDSAGGLMPADGAPAPLAPIAPPQ